MSRYVLVYQTGIANVFRVTSFNAQDYGRDAVRCLQSSFRNCEEFSRGLVEGGHDVRVAACNEAGDIVRRPWSIDTEETFPFDDEFCYPVGAKIERAGYVTGLTMPEAVSGVETAHVRASQA